MWGRGFDLQRSNLKGLFDVRATYSTIVPKLPQVICPPHQDHAHQKKREEELTKRGGYEEGGGD